MSNPSPLQPASAAPATDPLDLMVYSLPDPNHPAALTRPPSGRGKLLVVVFLCMLPMLLAYLAYNFVQPHGRAGVGELILPVQPMPDIALPDKEGKTVKLHALKGQWLLLGVSDASCSGSCAQRQFLQRQLRETLGKDKDRVDRVWLLQGHGAMNPAMVAQSGDLVLLQDASGELAPWLTSLTGKAVTDYLYVVDPQGNLMMRLPAQFDSVGAAKIRRDLERLLRATVAWDGPGR